MGKSGGGSHPPPHGVRFKVSENADCLLLANAGKRRIVSWLGCQAPCVALWDDPIPKCTQEGCDILDPVMSTPERQPMPTEPRRKRSFLTEVSPGPRFMVYGLIMIAYAKASGEDFFLQPGITSFLLGFSETAHGVLFPNRS